MELLHSNSAQSYLHILNQLATWASVKHPASCWLGQVDCVRRGPYGASSPFWSARRTVEGIMDNDEIFYGKLILL